jgi:hypothetical protein
VEYKKTNNMASYKTPMSIATCKNNKMCLPLQRQGTKFFFYRKARCEYKLFYLKKHIEEKCGENFAYIQILTEFLYTLKKSSSLTNYNDFFALNQMTENYRANVRGNLQMFLIIQQQK